jgi:hypothetical protein
VDPYYKKMMIAIGIALLGSIVAAIIIVEIVIRKYGS